MCYMIQKVKKVKKQTQGGVEEGIIDIIILMREMIRRSKPSKGTEFGWFEKGSL